MVKIVRVQAVLRSAAQLVDGRDKWCRGSLAVKNRFSVVPGEYHLTQCDPCDPGAEAWCADGALCRAVYGTDKKARANREHEDELAAARRAFSDYLYRSGLIAKGEFAGRDHVNFNDRYCQSGSHLAEHLRDAADGLEVKP